MIGELHHDHDYCLSRSATRTKIMIKNNNNKSKNKMLLHIVTAMLFLWMNTGTTITTTLGKNQQKLYAHAFCPMVTTSRVTTPPSKNRYVWKKTNHKIVIGLQKQQYPLFSRLVPSSSSTTTTTRLFSSLQNNNNKDNNNNPSTPKVEISPTNHGTLPIKDYYTTKESKSMINLDQRLLEVLQQEGWTKPTTIQSHAIPLITNGYDVMASSQTGSGKSLMFCLPLVNQLISFKKQQEQGRQRSSSSSSMAAPLALIISPTRELAVQTSEVLQTLCCPKQKQKKSVGNNNNNNNNSFSSKNCLLNIALATGGESLKQQRQALLGSSKESSSSSSSSSSCDVLVGTPGRILQFADQRELSFRELQFLIIDEADRLLDLGFEPQLTRISKLVSLSSSSSKQKQRDNNNNDNDNDNDNTNKIRHQSILCSATFPSGVQRMAADFLKPNYYFVSVGKVGSTHDRIQQQFEWGGDDDYDDGYKNNNKNFNNNNNNNNNDNTNKKKTSQQRRQDSIIRHVKAFLTSNKLQQQQKQKQGKNDNNNNNNNTKKKNQEEQSSVLVFSNTKEGADQLGKAFSQQQQQQKNNIIRCGVIHGDKVQSERNKVLEKFKNGKINVLIATDVAARGLDIPSVGLVVQAEAPRSLDTYTHRVGRTGRAGASGQAITVLNGKSIGIASGLIDLLTEAGQADSNIPSWLIGMSHVANARAIDEAAQVMAGGGGDIGDVVGGILGSSSANGFSDGGVATLAAATLSEEGGGGDIEDYSSEINENFTSQDFRRTAAEGSYGAGRDVAYRAFDDEAYGIDSDVTSDTDEDDEDWSDNLDESDTDEEDNDNNDDDEYDENYVYDDTSESTLEESSSTFVPQTPLDMLIAQEASSSSARFKRQNPSKRLVQVITKIAGSVDFDSGPDEKIIRALSGRGSDQQLRFEYLGMFPLGQVAPFLMTSYRKKSFEKNNNGDDDDDDDDSSKEQQLPQVLMVAEKPSIAKAIADALSGKRGPRQRRGISRALPVYEFTSNSFTPLNSDDGTPTRCRIIVTSVIGHVFSLGFDTPDQSQTVPSDFFHLPVVKQEENSSSKLRVVDHLRALAGKSDHLVLWLDCDPEGENIAHEVIAVTRRAIEANNMNNNNSNNNEGSDKKFIHRARFSAITQKALQDAFAVLAEPDAALSRSVDARQELDLRVGVAFTRLLTWKTVGLVRSKFDPATRVISYGPCQTPTLSFCVERAREIQQFQPEDYWKVNVALSVPGGNKKLSLKWDIPKAYEVEDTRNVGIKRKKNESSLSSAAVATTSIIDNATFNEASAKNIIRSANAKNSCLVVTNIETKHDTISPPVGLNTVALLEAGSKAMGMSPKQVMNVAEKLYSAGFISYPRTETTKYDPNGFDVRSALREHSKHELWGKSAMYLLRKKYAKSGRPPLRGRDVGDHPPITPLKPATRQEIGGGAAWRVYEFVARNFLGSLHNDLSFTRQIISLELSNDDDSSPIESPNFSFEYVTVDSLGFADCCRWVLNDIGASGRDKVEFAMGDTFSIASATQEKAKTLPPKFLQEHELILLMDENRIGTDASMAVHVNNIVDRGYVQLCDQTGAPLRPPRPPRPGQKPLPRQIGRYMVPTSLGIGLLDLFGQSETKNENTIGDDSNSNKDAPVMLSKPAIRRQMEEEVRYIATGELEKEQCIEKNLEWFEARHNELSEALTRDTIYRFGSNLSRTQESLRYWRNLGAFEATDTNNDNHNNVPTSKQKKKGGDSRIKGSPQRKGTNQRQKKGGNPKKGKQSGHKKAKSVKSTKAKVVS